MMFADNSKDDGMIAIHKSGGCYSLYLHGHDDIQSQFIPNTRHIRTYVHTTHTSAA